MGAMSGGGMTAASGFSIEGEYKKAFLPRYAAAVKARFDTAVATERPFFERLVHFWTNHFVVSGAKPGAICMPPSFERDAIRPNVTRRFGDMLMASSKHPAMLFYLDNFQSIGPNSKVGKDPSLRATRGAQAFAAPQKTGLNENLAREIMELQTLGVRSGYTQADVTSFARVITGWTIARPPHVPGWMLVAQGRLSGPGLFDFDEDEHEPGPQTILGKVYAQSGVDQGEAVLSDLARHPATARFISTKLARHFIADDPPPAVVEQHDEGISRHRRRPGGSLRGAGRKRRSVRARSAQIQDAGRICDLRRARRAGTERRSGLVAACLRQHGPGALQSARSERMARYSGGMAWTRIRCGSASSGPTRRRRALPPRR